MEESLNNGKCEEDSSIGSTKSLSCTSLLKGTVFEDDESIIESISELLNEVLFESLYVGVLCDSVINAASSNGAFKGLLCD